MLRTFFRELRDTFGRKEFVPGDGSDVGAWFITPFSFRNETNYISVSKTVSRRTRRRKMKGTRRKGESG